MWGAVPGHRGEDMFQHEPLGTHLAASSSSTFPRLACGGKTEKEKKR